MFNLFQKISRLNVIVFCLIFSLLIFPLQKALSSGFQVKTVGSMNVDGVTYSHLWYTNGNVTFTGITPTDTTVTATIDGSANPATVDAEGNWSYSTSLSEGDHNIEFSSSAGSHSFILTIGPVPEDVVGMPDSEVPTAGSSTVTIFITIIGSIFLIFGIKHLKIRQT